MKCLHCLVEFHAKSEVEEIGTDQDGTWFVEGFQCPSCNRVNLFLIKGEATWGSGVWKINTVHSRVAIRPKGANRPPCPAEVPPEITEDYTEACLVLSDSPKASAALSRRCLQNLLRTAGGVKPGELANEIQQVIDKAALPSNLAEAIDAIRNVGNFAAHPTKSKSTGEIVPVEPHEAEWNLEVLEELFDHYFVKPAKIAAKRAALDAKLVDAGKPPLK